MNNGSWKTFGMITAVCIIIFLAVLFLLRILPYLIFVGLICFVIISIRGHFKKNRKVYHHNSTSSKEHNDEQGEVIDVDFKEE